jgi:hypothetical protein
VTARKNKIDAPAVAMRMRGIAVLHHSPASHSARAIDLRVTQLRIFSRKPATKNGTVNQWPRVPALAVLLAVLGRPE